MTGVLVPVGDVAGLHDALVRLLREADLRKRLGAAARAQVIDRPSRAMQCDDLLDAYERALTRSTDAAAHERPLGRGARRAR